MAAPALFGRALGNEQLYLVAVIALVLWLAFYRNLVLSRYGVVFRTLRTSPVLASSIGYSPRRMKVLAYACGAFPAGVAGCLYGFIFEFLNPDLFALNLAIGIVAASVLGGTESIYGALAGAAFLQLGPMTSVSFQKYATVAYGAFLIVAAIVFRHGLSGLWHTGLRRLNRRLGHAAPVTDPVTVAVQDRRPPAGDRHPERTGAQPAHSSPASAGEAADLRVAGLSKAFAGAKALHEVSVTVPAGQITALIGSNGSGKTTLLNVVCGYVAPDSGSVHYGTRQLTGLAPHRIARLGVGRTFQTPSIPRGLSVLEAVASGRYWREASGVASSTLRLPRHWRAGRNERRAALDALDLVGLAHLRGSDAASLPLGMRRMLEVARSICAGAGLLLLDEPASGLNEAEVELLGSVVGQVSAAGSAVLLIEHNFGFVTAVADQAYVLHFGEVIAQGPALTIGQDSSVIQSYLGSAAAPAPPDGNGSSREADGSIAGTVQP